MLVFILGAEDLSRQWDSGIISPLKELIWMTADYVWTWYSPIRPWVNWWKSTDITDTSLATVAACNINNSGGCYEEPRGHYCLPPKHSSAPKNLPLISHYLFQLHFQLGDGLGWHQASDSRQGPFQLLLTKGQQNLLCKPLISMNFPKTSFTNKLEQTKTNQ